MEIRKEISIGSILQLLIILGIVISSFVYLKADVDRIAADQDEYITREQLDYIVIQRLDRLEISLDKKFEQLRRDLNENN